MVHSEILNKRQKCLKTTRKTNEFVLNKANHNMKQPNEKTKDKS